MTVDMDRNVSLSGMGDNCSNSSLNEQDEEPYQDLSYYIIPAVFGLICLVGVVGNGILIFIVVKNKSMRTTPNIFIVSLAIGDLLLLLVSVPFYGLIYTFYSWDFGVFFCKLSGFLKALSLGVSIFTLVALSIDRFMAIMFPMRRHAKSSTRQTIIVASCIWVIALGLAMFEGTIIHVSKPHEELDFYICGSHPAQWGKWFRCFRACFRFLVYFMIPIAIIGILYTLMAHKLWAEKLQTSNDTNATDRVVLQGQGTAATRQTQARKKVAKLVLSMVFLFIMCWLPMHIFFLWFHCPSPGEYNLFWHVWKMTSYCLSFLNSCINPVLLCILSGQFRRYFARYLCCCLKIGGTTKPGSGALTSFAKSHSDISSSLVNSAPTTKTFM